MENKTSILALLAGAFVVLGGLQLAVFPDSHSLSLSLQLLAVISALLFLVPGAVVGGLAAAAMTYISSPALDGPAVINYGVFLSALAVVSGYAAGQKNREEKLAGSMMSDGLTGLYNYTYFVDRLNEERRRADRFGSRTSLILVDIDNFRRYNDQFGQEKGNELLKTVADVLRIQVRGVDLVSRYGGEEFVVLLPNTGKAAALEVAERIVAAVAETEDGYTVSAGVASYPEHGQDDLQLIDHVEEALAAAKEAGRNRAVVYGPATENKSIAN